MFEDCTWKPRDLLYYLTLRSIIMYIREKVLYHPLVSIYTLRHQTTGPLPQVLPLDIVISIQCHFLRTRLPARGRWKMAPRLGGFMGSVPCWTVLLAGGDQLSRHVVQPLIISSSIHNNCATAVNLLDEFSPMCDSSKQIKC